MKAIHHIVLVSWAHMTTSTKIKLCEEKQITYAIKINNLHLLHKLNATQTETNFV